MPILVLLVDKRIFIVYHIEKSIKGADHMQKLKVDGFNGTYFICLDKNKKAFAIAKTEMPKNIKVGDLIIITPDGKIQKA